MKGCRVVIAGAAVAALTSCTPQAGADPADIWTVTAHNGYDPDGECWRIVLRQFTPDDDFARTCVDQMTYNTHPDGSAYHINTVAQVDEVAHHLDVPGDRAAAPATSAEHPTSPEGAGFR